MSRRFQGQTLAWVDWLERPDWAMTKLTWALPERQRLIVALLPRLVPSGLKVVEIGKDGYTIDDILVHNAHNVDDTLQLKLAMMDNEHGFPVALGVIRDVEAPTFDGALNEQIEEVKQQKKYHTFAELLETNDIWEVK